MAIARIAPPLDAEVRLDTASFAFECRHIMRLGGMVFMLVASKIHLPAKVLDPYVRLPPGRACAFLDDPLLASDDCRPFRLAHLDRREMVCLCATAAVEGGAVMCKRQWHRPHAS